VPAQKSIARRNEALSASRLGTAFALSFADPRNAKMKSLVLALVALFILLSISTSVAGDRIYEGSWHTTNRKLDGIMTCVVSKAGPEKWQGRFYGVWQGVAFDYKVPFSGPTSDLSGIAQIDGADYTWKGRITEGKSAGFVGTFGGSRYSGYFELREKRSDSSKR
jgi:hypothetical protein